MCFDSTNVAKINTREPLSGQTTSQNVIGDILCIKKKNYAFAGEYYISTNLEATSVFYSSEGDKKYDYMDDSYITYSADSYYDRGDSIPTYTITANTTFAPYSNGQDVFSIPQPDFSGTCSDSNIVHYEHNVPLSSCDRYFDVTDEAYTSTLASQCLYQYSVSRFVTDLWVSKQPVFDGDIKNNVIPVTLESIAFYDAASGLARDVTSTWQQNGCKTGFESPPSSPPSSDPPSTCTFSTHSNIANLAANISMCRSMVRSVLYTIHHNSSAMGAISSVTAVVVVGDLVITPSPAPLLWKQWFGAVFRSPPSPLALSSESGNLVYRQRSGNPGYLMAAPVLMGQLSRTEPVVVDELVSGMAIPTPFSEAEVLPSTCPTASTTNATVTTVVRFGYDTSSACLLRLSRSQLRQLCSNTSSTISDLHLDRSGVPFFLQPLSDRYIGSYGNADPLDPNQWLKLDITYSSSTTPIWNEESSTCSNFPTSLHYRFLIAPSAEKRTPQNRIISALATLDRSRVMTARSPPGDEGTPQPYQLTITVSFIYKDDSMSGYTPPSQPLMLTLPWGQLFSPFLRPNDEEI